MASKNLGTISKLMRKLDICMMTTQSGRGSFHSRPMSNNGDVTYNGVSYFFSFVGSRKVKELEKNPQVSLEFSGAAGLFISVAGKASLIRTRSKMEEHWQKSLNRWFTKGLDTPGVVMIQVKGNKLSYWQKDKQGEFKIS